MNENSSQSGNSSNGETLLSTNNPIQASLFTALVQVLVWPFLYVDLFMLFVFLKKQALQEEARYMLFAQTLFADSCILVLTDFTVITMHVQLLLPTGICIPVVMFMEALTNLSPTIIVAMCLERYVAICRPLKHANIFSPRQTFICIAFLWSLCFFIPFVDLCIMFAFVSKSYFTHLTFCYYEIMFVGEWHTVMRGFFYIAEFFAILCILLFCYTSVIIVAHRASGDDKQSASKGQRTILFHLFQLLLCTLAVICPYVESQVMLLGLREYLIVRFFNFLAFSIFSKILSTLIYGFRDEKFFAAMKSYIKPRINDISHK